MPNDDNTDLRPTVLELLDRALTAERAVEKLRKALGIIRTWDMLNPAENTPEPLADGPYFRRLIDDALTHDIGAVPARTAVRKRCFGCLHFENEIGNDGCRFYTDGHRLRDVDPRGRFVIGVRDQVLNSAAGSGEHICSCDCNACDTSPYPHGCGGPRCNGPKRWKAATNERETESGRGDATSKVREDVSGLEGGGGDRAAGERGREDLQPGRSNASGMDSNASIVRAMNQGFRLGVERSLDMARSQVWDRSNPEEPNDEYRRGQRRGAKDCVSMIGRLLSNVPPLDKEMPQHNGPETKGQRMVRLLHELGVADLDLPLIMRPNTGRTDPYFGSMGRSPEEAGAEAQCPECRWPASSGHASPEGIPCSRTPGLQKPSTTRGFYINDEDRKNAADLHERVTFYCKGLVIPDKDRFVAEAARMFGAVRASAKQTSPSASEFDPAIYLPNGIARNPCPHGHKWMCPDGCYPEQNGGLGHPPQPADLVRARRFFDVLTAVIDGFYADPELQRVKSERLLATQFQIVREQATRQAAEKGSLE